MSSEHGRDEGTEVFRIGSVRLRPASMAKYESNLTVEPLMIFGLSTFIIKSLHRRKGVGNFHIVIKINLVIDHSALWANSWGQKVLIFFRNSLTQSVLELEKCSFFLNGSEFRQKLIGTIISTVFPTK